MNLLLTEEETKSSLISKSIVNAIIELTYIYKNRSKDLLSMLLTILFSPLIFLFFIILNYKMKKLIIESRTFLSKIQKEKIESEEDYDKLKSLYERIKTKNDQPLTVDYTNLPFPMKGTVKQAVDLLNILQETGIAIRGKIYLSLPSNITEKQIIEHSKKLADFEEDWKEEDLDIYDKKHALNLYKKE